MEDNILTFKLDAFEGPLDLLLSLIQKNKVSITDIPIAMICDQYMEYIKAAEKMDMELTADFIVMAAQLMYIKSQMLLPRDDENDEDPRKVLVDALLLYQEAKKNAQELRPLYSLYSGRIAKDNDDVPPEKGFPLGLDPALLTKALATMVARYKVSEQEPQELVNPLIKVKTVSVRKMIDVVVQKLTARPTASLFHLLKDAESKAELIARFMGILEMIKLQQIFLCEEKAEYDDDMDYYPPDEYGGNTLTGLLMQVRLNPDYVPGEESESEFDKEDEENDRGNDDTSSGK